MLFLSAIIGIPLNIFVPADPSDGVVLLIVFGLFSLYFTIGNACFEATVGQRVLGYKIIPAIDEKPYYIVRFILGFVAFFLGFITWLGNRHVKDGTYWWDYESNTRAVPLHYVAPN